MSRTTHTTTDLVVRHSQQHLVRRSALRHLHDISAPVLFAAAGLATLGMAVAIVRQAGGEPTPVFMALDATNYAAQQAFYTGSELRAAAPAVGDTEAIVEKMHAAANAKEWSRQLMTLGVAMLVGTFAWASHHFGWWGGHVQFTVRRISK